MLFFALSELVLWVEYFVWYIGNIRWCEFGKITIFHPSKSLIDCLIIETRGSMEQKMLVRYKTWWFLMIKIRMFGISEILYLYELLVVGYTRMNRRQKEWLLTYNIQFVTLLQHCSLISTLMSLPFQYIKEHESK